MCYFLNNFKFLTFQILIPNIHIIWAPISVNFIIQKLCFLLDESKNDIEYNYDGGM